MPVAKDAQPAGSSPEPNSSKNERRWQVATISSSQVVRRPGRAFARGAPSPSSRCWLGPALQKAVEQGWQAPGPAVRTEKATPAFLTSLRGIQAGQIGAGKAAMEFGGALTSGGRGRGGMAHFFPSPLASHGEGWELRKIAGQGTSCRNDPVGSASGQQEIDFGYTHTVFVGRAPRTGRCARSVEVRARPTICSCVGKPDTQNHKPQTGERSASSPRAE